MSFFGDGKGRAQRGGACVDTLIGHPVVLSGEVRFAGGLYVEGRLVGKAVAEDGATATITVAPRGVVEGELRAPVVIINGRVKGVVHAAERLELGPEARVEGDLHYTVVEMAAGAEVSGKLVHLAPAASDGAPSAGGGRKAASPSPRSTGERETTPA